jgi:rhamnosyltransferase
MSYDILIPTYEASQCIRNVLEAIARQTVRPDNVVIVDSSSTDTTVEITKSKNCKIIRIPRKEFDHGSTRNLGVAQTKSDYIVFLTQDAIPADEHTIEELIKPLQDPTIAVCYGRQLPRPSAGPLERFAREFNYPDKSQFKAKDDIKKLGLKTFFCSNSCAAYRRSIFEELGGFKEKAITNEDMHFAARAILADYSVYYSAEAKVYHSHAYSMGQTFKRYFNTGRFFADNRWILKNAGLKNYGGGMLMAGMITFLKNRMPHYAFALLVEFIVKACACTTGRWYQQLFYSIRR